MKKIVEKLLENGKVTKHYTYNQTGIVCGNCKKISGTAGKDVDYFYIYPKAEEGKQVEVCYNNTHYGYAHIKKDGRIYDNSNRSVFEII